MYPIIHQLFLAYNSFLFLNVPLIVYIFIKIAIVIVGIIGMYDIIYIFELLSFRLNPFYTNDQSNTNINTLYILHDTLTEHFYKEHYNNTIIRVSLCSQNSFSSSWHGFY